MPNKFSRKNFITLTTLAGAGLILDACGAGGERGEKERGESSEELADSTNRLDEQKEFTYSVKLIRKEDIEYEVLRKGFNKRINKYPLIIALCTSTKDVSEAIQYAKINKLAVAIKSGGHSMEGFSSNDGGLVINLSKMNSVEFLENNTIKVGPCCTLSNLYDQILPKKRLLPAGSCGTVGIGGLTMGGGYGLFSRKFGLTCDHLMEATFVDGNGKIQSTNDDPELLWALRGGGAGNFSVVTEMVFRTQEAPAVMRSYHFKARKLDAKRAKNILEKWFEFTSKLSETCFSAFVLNGSTLNILVTNFGEHNSNLENNLKELALHTDEFRSVAPIELSKKLKNYYGSLVPVNFKNSSAGLYKSYNDISGFIADVFEKIIHSPGMIYQLNTLGGKINDAEFEKVSCYPHRVYNYISELQAYWEDPAHEEKLNNVSVEILDIFKSNGITSQYINYCSTEFSNWENAYYGNNYPRLQEVKKKYDASDVVRYAQSVRVNL